MAEIINLCQLMKKKKKCIKTTFSFQGRMRLPKLRRCLWCVSEEVTMWVI